MRSRPLAAVLAASVLAFSTAACGGDDEPVAAGPTTVPEASPDSPYTTPEASTDDAPASSDDKTSADDTPQTQAEKDAPKGKANGDLLPVVAAANPDLTNFTTALGAAGLTATLGQNGPYTVFAPNNDGFAKLGTRLDTLLQPASKAELVNILSFHVVSGDYRLKDLKDGTLLTSLQGTRLRVSKKGDTITIGNKLGDARIVSTNVDAGNGVIHVIDTVLAPKTK